MSAKLAPTCQRRSRALQQVPVTQHQAGEGERVPLAPGLLRLGPPGDPVRGLLGQTLSDPQELPVFVARLVQRQVPWGTGWMGAASSLGFGGAAAFPFRSHPAKAPGLGRALLGASTPLVGVGTGHKLPLPAPTGTRELRARVVVVLPRAGWSQEGSAGPYPGASRSGKFINTAKLLMFLEVHQVWISYFKYLT